MSVAAVSAAGVRKKYPGERGVQALETISVDVPAGRFVSILGPSGCGKSTFLRCVAGLETISEGELRVAGQPVKGPPDGIGMVFQRDALLEWRNIRRNILLPVEFAGKPVARYRDKVDALLRLTGLAAFADNYPRELSGGMRQRAAICRALVDDPALLLMDEPFAALDALTRRQMQDELLKLCEETGSTALFVTHGIDEAIRVGTRILALTPHPGRLAATFDVPPDTRIRGTARFAELERQIQQSVFADPETEHV